MCAREAPSTALAAHDRRSAATTESRPVRWLLTAIALAFLTLFLLVPLVSVFWEAFSKGWELFAAALTEPEAVSAIRLTLLTAALGQPFPAGLPVIQLLLNDSARFDLAAGLRLRQACKLRAAVAVFAGPRLCHRFDQRVPRVARWALAQPTRAGAATLGAGEKGFFFGHGRYR